MILQAIVGNFRALYPYSPMGGGVPVPVACNILWESFICKTLSRNSVSLQAVQRYIFSVQSIPRSAVYRTRTRTFGAGNRTRTLRKPHPHQKNKLTPHPHPHPHHYFFYRTRTRTRTPFNFFDRTRTRTRTRNKNRTKKLKPHHQSLRFCRFFNDDKPW